MQFFCSQLHYISPNLGGGGTASPSAFTSVFAYIGSPPQLRRQSRLSWRQGPLYLLEDIVSSSVISSIYHLGPTYVGSLQAPLSGEQWNELIDGMKSTPRDDSLVRQGIFLPESALSADRLMVSVHPFGQSHAFTSVNMLKIPYSL